MNLPDSDPTRGVWLSLYLIGLPNLTSKRKLKAIGRSLGTGQPDRVGLRQNRLRLEDRPALSNGHKCFLAKGDSL